MTPSNSALDRAVAEKIPFIDPRIEWFGVSALRQFNTRKLRALEMPVVITDTGSPIAVLVPYRLYIEIQQKIYPEGL